MRVSVDNDDPDYIGFGPTTPHYRVWLNDREVKFAITADDEAGVVISHKVDENGRVVLGDKPYELARETQHGRVRIERI